MPTVKFHCVVATKLARSLDIDICSKKSNCSEETWFYRASAVPVPSHKAGHEAFASSFCQTATDRDQQECYISQLLLRNLWDRYKMRSSGIPQRQGWRQTAKETRYRRFGGGCGENTHITFFFPFKAYIERKLYANLTKG